MRKNIGGSLILLFLSYNLWAQVVPAGGVIPIATNVTPLPAPYNSTCNNYLKTFTPQIPLTDGNSINESASVEVALMQTTYVDGSGRVIQEVSKQLSPLKQDFVEIAVYDAFGRKPIEYLPYVAPTGDGSFKQNAFQQDSAFYKALYPYDQVIYSQIRFDGSPLNIPIKVLAPGNEWGGMNRGISSTVRSNTFADSVKYWEVDVISENDVPFTALTYTPGSLTVKETVDEHGVRSQVFSDILGRTILVKNQENNTITSGHTGWLCTYYVYDEVGKLRAIIPPKATSQLAASNWSFTGANAALYSGLCYSFFYDNRGRQIVNFVPGKGFTYVAYDAKDRPVLVKDQSLGVNNPLKWVFTKYDAESRPIATGTILVTGVSGSSITDIQQEAAKSIDYPLLNASNSFTILTQTFYDNYDFITPATASGISNSAVFNDVSTANFPYLYTPNTWPYFATPLQQSARIKGYVTGYIVKNIEGTNPRTTAIFYDENGRAFQTQQKNASEGIDVTTVQYAYKGNVLSSFTRHNKGGINPVTHTILTKYTYDHVGRLLFTTKNIDNLGDKTISQNTYLETGQLQTKDVGIGAGSNFNGGSLQSQRFTYNIRGMLTSINGNYVNNTSTIGNEYFGEILSYGHGFSTAQYNGNIAGVQWKNAGDNITRAYGYTYDKANRLVAADFTQQNEGSTDWNNNLVDYTVSNLRYDAGGNILSMKQKGLLGLGQNAVIDDLHYTYFNNTNKLQNVNDFSTITDKLGDFKDSTNTTDDYQYDAMGNIIADNNRHLHTLNGNAGSTFNILNKPDSMAISGRSNTYYTYDAKGSLLSKKVKNFIDNTVKTYTYLAGFVYVNDTLQYIMMEEGRIRLQTNNNITQANFDYFIKDHAGNIRTVLTDEARKDYYPAATMETAQAAIEEQLYNNLPETRINKNTIPGYPTDNTTTPNDFVAKLQATTGSQKIGPNILLKVMRGDTINIKANSWYRLNTGTTPANPIGLPVNTIVNSIITGVVGNKVLNKNDNTLAEFTNAGIFVPDVTNFINNQTNNSNNTKPKAFLNWIFFDEQFHMVSAGSGFSQVGASQEFKLHVQQAVAEKCGFIYVYTSNETPNVPVYFDNIQVSHSRSPVLETNEYYPYGLKMKNISYRAALVMENKYGYNGGNEYEDEGELNYSTTFYRKYDAQIGRFTSVDIFATKFSYINPYQFGINNPVMFNDPTGALTRAELQNIIAILWNSDFGGSWSAGCGGCGSISYGGGSISLFGSSDQAFGAGAAYMGQHNSWGAQPGWAGSFSQALQSYNGGRLTAPMVQGYYEQRWQNSGRRDIAARDAGGVHAGRGFDVRFSFDMGISGNGNDLAGVGIGDLFVTTEKMMALFEGDRGMFGGLNDFLNSFNIPVAGAEYQLGRDLNRFNRLDQINPSNEAWMLKNNPYLKTRLINVEIPVVSRHIEVPRNVVKGIGKGLQVLGVVTAGVSIANDISRYRSGEISGAHLAVNTVMNVVGFLGPIGTGVSIVYGLTEDWWW